MIDRFTQVMHIVREISHPHRNFHAIQREGQVYIQLTYVDQDIKTGKDTLQYSRRWIVEPDDSETKIVETCWAALKRSLEHEAAEWFKYKGRRVYSPHFAVDARIGLCDTERFDGD